jgi:hypothetical protein
VLLDLRKEKGSPVIKVVKILSHKYLLLLAIGRESKKIEKDKGKNDKCILLC